MDGTLRMENTQAARCAEGTVRVQHKLALARGRLDKFFRKHGRPGFYGENYTRWNVFERWMILTAGLDAAKQA